MFHLIWVLARGETCSVRHSEDVGINGNGWLPEGFIQNHIGRLPADTWQANKVASCLRHVSAELIKDHLAKRDHVLRLVPPKPDGLDVLLYAAQTEREHLLRRIGDLEELSCRLVHADICGLGRKRDGYNEGVGVYKVQLCARVWALFRQDLVKRIGLVSRHGARGAFLFSLRGRFRSSHGLGLVCSRVLPSCGVFGFAVSQPASTVLAMSEMRPETIYLDAILTPNSSLSPRGYGLVTGLIKAGIGFSVLMMAISLWSMLGGSAAPMALPVFGFFGLDIAALWVALRHIQTQNGQETRVRITATKVTLNHRDGAGREKQAELPTAFARVELDEPVQPASWLRIEYGQTAYVIGRFLTPKERKSLAVRLRRALIDARAERYPA